MRLYVPPPAHRLAVLAERLEAVRPLRTMDMRALDWDACQAAARAAADLPEPEWWAWQATVRASAYA